MSGRVVVLGAGVAGESFVATLRRLDGEVPITLVERELVGGECSYWACIPSKTLLRPLEVVHGAQAAPGAAEAVAAIDHERVFRWRDEVAGKNDESQAKWVEGLGVELVRGEAEIAAPGCVRVDRRELDYEHLVVATGSLPTAPRLEGFDELDYWTSREATSASTVPKTLVVIGGGAVGCELAQVYARLGSRVTLVQRANHLLERIDHDAGDLLAAALEREGVELRLGTRPTAVEWAGSTYRVLCDGQDAIEGTHLLVATGRHPNVAGFGLERLEIGVEERGIEVDERLAAGENVWAAGDVTGVALFTHVGKYQGRVAAANVAGHERRADYRAIPAAIFTDPQVAAVGQTSGNGAVTATWPLERVSRTSTYQKPARPGFLKLFADPEHRVLVGAVAVGPEASEWLGQLTLAVRAEVPIDVLVDTIQPFPTFSEAVFFAARELEL